MAHYEALRFTRVEMFLLRLEIQLGLKPNTRGNVFAGFATDPLPERVPLAVEFTHDTDPIPFAGLRRRRWKRIVPGTRWGGNFESAWFRFRGRVPKAWRGAEVLYRISTGSEACVFDRLGNPVQGLESNRNDFPLANPARGGEAAFLLVEAAANQQQGIKKDCVLELAALERFRRDRWDLFLDIDFLFSQVRLLAEDDTRRLRVLRQLDQAANRYGNGGPAEVRACRRITRRLLASPAHASAQRFSAVGHAHIDTAWLWPLRETVRKCGRTFSTVLQYMRQYPDYLFGASQPQQYAYVKQAYPGLYARIRRAVREGRWEPQGGMWVEPDGNLPSGESFVRQLLHGTRFFEREFGVRVNNLWMPDTFGYSAALPQLLRLAEIEYFMTTKLNWSKLNRFPHRSFWWEGLDGSRVFAHLPSVYVCSARPQVMQRFVTEFRERDRASRQLFLFGKGDGGGGPMKEDLEFIRRSRNAEGLPRIAFEQASSFFPKARAECKDWPLWQGELYLETHRGTLTSQAWLKKANRRGEFDLRDLEFLLAAAGDSRRYPRRELDRAWKLLLLNQFHDILPGSSIRWVYEDSRRQFEELERIVAPLRQQALARLSSRLQGPTPPPPGARHVLAVNTLSWTRQALLELPLQAGEARAAVCIPAADGTLEPLACQRVGRGRQSRILVGVALPAMGWASLWVGPAPRRTPPIQREMKALPNRLENDLLCLRFDRLGGLRSIYDKQNRREVLAGLGNALNVYEDLPSDYDAWDLDIHYEDRPPLPAVLVRATVTESGPLRVSLRQERIVGASRIVQEIRLTAGSRVATFHTWVDWRETHQMLRVAFPVAVRAEQASYEIQYGHLQRPTHRNNSWDAAKWEVCGHKWADLSEPGYGVALLNDSKYGYKILGHTLDLNLLRSPTLPDPECDRGEHTFTYALLPHAGTLQEGEVVREGYALNVPPLIHGQTLGRPRRRRGLLPVRHSLVEIREPNVVLEALKKAEDSDALIVRLYESHGRHGPATLKFPFQTGRIAICNLLERRDIAVRPTRNGTLRLRLRPFEVLTLKVARTP